MLKARLMLAICLGFSTFTPAAHSEEVSVGDAYDAYNQFMLTVRVFDEFEKRDGTFQANTGVHLKGFAALLMSEAVASPGKDGTKCLLAGYYGVVKGTRCVPTPDISMFDAKGNLICSPTTFGTGIVIPHPKDSRWTVACANEVIKKAGVAGKTVDDQLSADEIKKLGVFLRDKQNISFSNNVYNSIIYDCERLNAKSQDARDCKRILEVVGDGLRAYKFMVPGTATTQTTQTKETKPAGKSFEDCWREWSKKDAKLKVKTAISMEGKFDSFIKLKSLAGCRLSAVDKSAWESEGISIDYCKMPVGADATVVSYDQNDKDLRAITTLTGSVECAKPDKTVVKKSGTLRITCSTAGSKRVIWQQLRLMERNFTLIPACTYADPEANNKDKPEVKDNTKQAK